MDKTSSLLLLLLFTLSGYSQPLHSYNDALRGAERTLRYTPDGEDFVIVNGDKKFNRALYGNHTGFRVETGDVPEFALYMPRMGGNLSFSVRRDGEVIPLNRAKYIESRYRAGSRIYTLKDPLLENGWIRITALALRETDGVILKIEAADLPEGTALEWLFGGASNIRFSREGDLGVDPPDCFDLKPENCADNVYHIEKNTFTLRYGSTTPHGEAQLYGTFPTEAELTVNGLPALNGTIEVKKIPVYMALYSSRGETPLPYSLLEHHYEKAEEERSRIASRIRFNTPDPYLDPVAGALAIAADGIWSGEVFLHGAIGWRMPLNGWRAAYAGDALGWHDRARTHFNAYAASQVTEVDPIYPHPTQDEALHLARAEKRWGTQMYSNGYICRNPYQNTTMHHYNMNLCYIDELFWHLNWTGDIGYAREIWPVIRRHLEWEKRNYDPDGDGLYDAYCCIWASDALYYNSGGVTHSTAYNYRANKMAAMVAEKIGEDPAPYQKEADKIAAAMNRELWLDHKGHWAEFKELMGHGRLHEFPGLWSIYHPADAEVNNPFQAYQATRYIDTEIPHIPVVAKGLPDEGYHTLSTTNWLPYAWSINNVAFAEVMHTALAYWQAGRNEAAYLLLKSSLLDGMYLGSSPGNFGQISFYDAARGECYRDFGDPVGIASRAFIQGLFGLLPDAMNGRLVIRPGYPREWENASLSTPDIHFNFTRSGHTDHYHIGLSFEKEMALSLQVRNLTYGISSVTVNGTPAEWKQVENAVGFPVVEITAPPATAYTIAIEWKGAEIVNRQKEYTYKAKPGENLQIKNNNATVTGIYDPQSVLGSPLISGNTVTGKLTGIPGHRTLFLHLEADGASWYQPVHIEIEAAPSPYPAQFATVNSAGCEPVKMDHLWNESVNRIFLNEYRTPRSPYTTLQIPIQGIGEWCHPLTTAEIDDSGIRGAVQNGVLTTPLGIPFRTPAEGKNIAFTSLWDNYPDKIAVSLAGKARNAYLMMAGTTNHMQCHRVNGTLTIYYKDNSTETVELISPENWCPIEQDFFADGMAFRLKAPRPYRIHLKTGLVSNNLETDLDISGVYGRAIDGGAGLLLDIPLNPEKELDHLELETLSNEVIIGIMSITLQR